MVKLLLLFMLFHRKSNYCSDLPIIFVFDETQLGFLPYCFIENILYFIL